MKTENEKLKEEVFKLMEEAKLKLGLTNNRIAIGSDISPSSLTAWESGKSNPSRRSLIQIREYIESQLYPADNDAMINEFAEMISKNAVLSNITLISKVDKEEYKRYIDNFRNEDYINALPLMPFRTDKEYKDKHIIFELKGDSMNDGTKNALLDNDLVLCRNIGKEHWRFPLPINQWYYIIVHKNLGVIHKEIVSHDVDGKTITCRSINRLYGDDFVIQLKDVLELYNIVDLVSRSLAR